MSEQSRKPMSIVPYNPDWALEYKREQERLLNALSPRIATMEHVGSTSIPNQAAKPVIDMFAAFHTLEAPSVYSRLLKDLGYSYTDAGMTGRHLFVKKSGGARTHHLHMLPSEHFYERNELLFRDYLRAHPESVSAYGELKLSLMRQFSLDPEAYTRAKTDFIQQIVDRARTEKGLPLQSVWED
ncbi:GrpB family protein [Paenibacillus piri]|nr:GrpB family protein [Paenibacillus piri]